MDKKRNEPLRCGLVDKDGKIVAIGTHAKMSAQRRRGETGLWGLSKADKVGDHIHDRYGNIQTAIDAK